MSVTNVPEIIQIGKLADMADAQNLAEFNPTDFPGFEVLDTVTIDGPIGFQAWAF